MFSENTPPEKFRRLILALSSDRPDEVVAAAKAIGKMLTVLASNWHTFALAASGVRTPDWPPKNRPGPDLAGRILANYGDVLSAREQKALYDLSRSNSRLPAEKARWLMALFAGLGGVLNYNPGPLGGQVVDD